MELEEELLHEVERRCRLCLEKTVLTVNLKEFANPKREELTYWDILLQFCVIETGQNINAPQTICADCAKNMENLYGFKIMCENSDKVLKAELSHDISEDGNSSALLQIHHDYKIELMEEKVNVETQNIVEEIQSMNKINKALNIVEKSCEEPECTEQNEEDMENLITLSDNSVDVNFELVDPDHPDDDLVSLSSDEEPTTTCEVCDVMFANLSVYKQHMTERHSVEQKLLERFSCGYKPADLEDYNKHMLKHKTNSRNSRRVKCPFCGEVFRGQNLVTHMLKEHREKNIGCTYCDEHIFKPNCLIRHMKQKHPAENIVCTLCEFKSDVHDLYYVHMTDSHRDFFQVRKCEFCEYTTISVISLGKHMTSEHEDKKTLKCTICEKCFFSEKTRQRHEKSHGEATRFYCETCGKSYKHKRDLNNHMDGHSKDKVIECGICQKKFNRIDNYVSHKRSHSDERSFKCDECGNCFKRRQGLNNHVDRVHKKIKKCECSICFKKFSTGNELKVHMKRHSGLKEVQCEFCDKSFCRNWELKQHMVVHTGERRFVCEVCGKGFTQAQVLRGHMKTHNR